MPTTFASVPMPLYNDPAKWVKIIVPLDTFDIVEKTNWCWHHSFKDAFPINYKPSLIDFKEKSFCMMAKLRSSQSEYDATTSTWNLLKCDRVSDDFLLKIENLYID